MSTGSGSVSGDHDHDHDHDHARSLSSASPFFAVALTAAALLLYAPSLHGPFVFDGANIVNGAFVHISSLGELGRILSAEGVPRRIGYASFALNFYFGGLDPLGYHLVNVVLHALNAFLLGWLAQGLLQASGTPERRARLVGMGGAALWMIHPLQTQAVSYLYQRFTVLCTFFFLVSLCAFFEAQRRAQRFMLYAVSLTSGLLALGTKEIAATLPLFLLGIGLWGRKNGVLLRDRRTLALAGLCLVSFLVVCGVFLGPDFVTMMQHDYARRGFTLHERLLTESRVVMHYLSLVLYPSPSRLTLDYDFPLSTGLLTPPTTLLSLGGIGLLLGVAVAQRRKRPLLALALVWLFANLAIESTFVPLDLVYEHRVYLPGMMLFVLLADALVSLSVSDRFRWLAFGAAVTLAGLWSYWTYERNGVWADPVALWRDNAEKAPNKARVHGNLGFALMARGEPAEARRSLERAIELDETLWNAHTALAILYIQGQDWEEARRVLDRVVEEAPDFAPAHVAQSVLFLERRDFRSAARASEEALALDGSNQAALHNLGAARFNLGEYREAVAALETGVAYWPVNAPMHALLGASLVELGDAARAERVLDRALELDPANALARRYRPRLQERSR